MRFRDDTRGVTVQIGAVMLFATIIIALALYQATVVPSQNADIEYTHSQQAETQLTEVRNALLSTAASGNTRASSVELGTGYPSRVFLMNPPPAAGTLRTGSHDNDTVQVSNVVATNPETADFVDGTWTASTKYLEYAPDYNEYDGAPTLRYEASMLSNVFPEDNTTVPLTDQVLVRGDTITLVALQGSMSTSRTGSVSVTPDATSAPYQRVQVEPETASDPVTVTVPTSVAASTFRNRTELGDRANVSVVDGGDDQVEIRLSGDGPYTLQTARVDVGSESTDVGAHYLTVVENDSDSVTVEARDEFNNPVSGVDVTVSGGSNLVSAAGEVTDEDGRATFDAEADESGDVTFEILDGSEARERVTVPVDTTATGSGGGTGGGAFDVEWVDATGSGIDSCDSGFSSCTVNANNGTTVTLTASVTENSELLTDATVDYARNSSNFPSAGAVSMTPTSASTDAAGESTTTVDVPEENGTVRVYAASGGDADPIDIHVEHPTQTGGPSALNWYVTDDTNTNNGTARYRVSYGVSNVSDFSYAEATFENLNTSDLTSSTASNSTSGTLAYDFDGGRGAGDTYNVSIRVYDTDGNVVLRNSTIDVADNTDPLEGDPGSGENAPGLEGVRIDDLGQDSEPRYYVSYNVTNPQNFQNVEVEFQSLNESWADQTSTSTSTRGGFSYEDSGTTSEATYRLTVRVFDTNGTLTDQRIVEDEVDGVNPSGNDDLAESDSPTLASSTITDATGNSGARYLVDYGVDDPDGRFGQAKVVFLNRNNTWASEQWTSTSLSGGVLHSSGGTGGNSYRIMVQVLDADGVVVGQDVLSDVADGSVDGSSSTATSTQISNFGKNTGQDQFTAQVQSQDSDGDTDMDRIEYVVLDSAGNVVATATRTGSGQQIQPGSITIQSDANVQGGQTYTLYAVGYDADGNYDWVTDTA